MVGHTDGDIQAVSLVWLDGHQIVLDHSHGVAVDREHISGPCRPVNEPQNVLLPLCERRVEVCAGPCQRVMAYPVDHETVCPCMCTSYLDIVSDKGRVVHVVLDEDRAKINIPIAACGPMNDEWTGQAVRILSECQHQRCTSPRGLDRRDDYTCSE